MVYRMRHAMTTGQKEKIWEYVRSELRDGNLTKDAVVFSTGTNGARHPSVDLTLLNETQGRMVLDLIRPEP
jgi:hypothetical protein